MRTPKLFSIHFVYYCLIIILLYVPILVLIVFSFNNSELIVLPLKGFTLKWYTIALSTKQLVQSVWNSVSVAVVSSAIATILGTMGALTVIRFRFSGRFALLVVALAPLIVPYVVVGVALLIFFDSLGINTSLMTVSVAHIVICIPVALIYVAARIANFPSNLEEASMDLGANYWETLGRVTIPLIMPALVASFLTCFTVSFNEFAIANFLVGTKATLPVYMFSQLRIASRVPLIIAISSLIMVISVCLLIFSERLRQIGQNKGKRITQ
jgi:spermidine/putrescine transport system permease protein